MFTWCLLCTKHSSYINPRNPCKYLCVGYYSHLPFNRWRHWGTERLSNLPRVTQLAKRGARIWTQAVLSAVSMLLTLLGVLLAYGSHHMVMGSLMAILLLPHKHQHCYSTVIESLDLSQACGKIQTTAAVVYLKSRTHIGPSQIYLFKNIKLVIKPK